MSSDKRDRLAEEWGRKGATLSDKTARAEYGLTHRKVRLREKADFAVPQRTRRKLAAVLRLAAAPIFRSH